MNKSIQALNRIKPDNLFFNYKDFLSQGSKHFVLIKIGLFNFLYLLIGYLTSGIEKDYNVIQVSFTKFIDYFPDIFNAQIINDYSILATLYVILTLLVFDLSLILLPYLFTNGKDALENVLKYYSQKRKKSINNRFNEIFTNKKRNIYFIVLFILIFLIGEIWVMLAYSVTWPVYFIIYLLTLPVLLNSILIGTQSYLVTTIITLIRELSPLPGNLYDEDGCCGLRKAGIFILKVSACWFIVMGFISQLFVMSGNAGIMIFILLATIGATSLFFPLYHFHNLLNTRKNSLLYQYSSILNKLVKKYKNNPSEETKEKIEFYEEKYLRASKLKTWVFRTTPSIFLQIMTLFWPFIQNKMSLIIQ